MFGNEGEDRVRMLPVFELVFVWKFINELLEHAEGHLAICHEKRASQDDVLVGLGRGFLVSA
jgi:hypothetical protein